MGTLLYRWRHAESQSTVHAGFIYRSNNRSEQPGQSNLILRVQINKKFRQAALGRGQGLWATAGGL
jgi:hypothetical protein